MSEWRVSCKAIGGEQASNTSLLLGKIKSERERERENELD